MQKVVAVLKLITLREVRGPEAVAAPTLSWHSLAAFSEAIIAGDLRLICVRNLGGGRAIHVHKKNTVAL